jgi:ribonuclease Z
MSSFSLTILGSNSALPTSERYPTAQILNVSERFFLIDCGEGTQIQLRKNKINFSKINHIFISHLHGDHCFGLIGLISSFGLLGRSKPLYIYAHKDLQLLLQPQLDFFCVDLPYQIKFIELQPKEQIVIYEDKKVIVESFPLSHRIATCGFLFREKEKEPNIVKEAIVKYDLTIQEIAALKRRESFFVDGIEVPQNELIKEPRVPRSYAFCSDTRYYRRLIPVVDKVSLLYHEATFLHQLKDLAKSTGHTTAKQAATIANDANVGKLLIGHFSSRYHNLKPLLDEARQEFPNTELGLDNQTYLVE